MEIENELERIIVIFRYLENKDVFETFYKNFLAKRLLTGRSSSDELEQNLIQKLKKECGYQFSSKLEGMFKDMKISKEITEKFHRSEFNIISSSSPFELSATVLTPGNFASFPPAYIYISTKPWINYS